MIAKIERCPHCNKVLSKEIIESNLVNNYHEEVAYKICPKCEKKLDPATLKLLNAIHGIKTEER